MGCQHHPVITLTTFKTLLLSFICLFFNSSELEGKGTVSIGNLKHKATFSFGQQRRMNSTVQTIHTSSEFEALFKKDWSAYNLKTVVIDPGHGGKDSGTRSSDGVLEKNIALSISKRLGKYIATYYPKVKVIYTRSKDVFIPLKKRARIANKNKADLFISIHCNSFKKSWVRGMETYVLGLEKSKENMEVIKRENSVVQLEENYENEYEEYGVDRSSPLYDILMNSYQNAHLEQSLAYASTLEQKFKSKKLKTRGVHQAGFVVLRRTAMPSVLIETGYLTNPKDKTILTSSKGQQQIARELFTAFEDYMSHLDNDVTKEIIQVKTVNHPEQHSTTDNSNFNTGIQFVIQVAAVEKLLDTSEKKWSYIKENMFIEKTHDEKMRYMVKGFGNDFKAADQKRAELSQLGFKDCFLVAYQHGMKVDVLWAKQQTEQK